MIDEWDTDLSLSESCEFVENSLINKVKTINILENRLIYDKGRVKLHDMRSFTSRSLNKPRTK